MSKPAESTQTCDSIVITVKVVPGSSRTQSTGRHGQAYKIKIAAPPENGKANEMLIGFLAKELDIKKNAVQIKSGKTSSLKQILLQGVSEQNVQSVLG